MCETGTCTHGLRCRPQHSDGGIVLQLLRTPPGGWSLTHRLSKVLAQVRLVRETETLRDVAQGRIGLKHALGGQLDPTPDYESVR